MKNQTQQKNPTMLDIIDRTIIDLERKRDKLKEQYDATNPNDPDNKFARINLTNMMGVYNDNIILLSENKILYYTKNN